MQKLVKAKYDVLAPLVEQETELGEIDTALAKFNEIGDTITYLSRYDAKNSDIIMNKNPKYATVYYNFEEANQDARHLFGQYQMYIVVEKRQSGLFGDAYQDYRSFG